MRRAAEDELREARVAVGARDQEFRVEFGCAPHDRLTGVAAVRDDTLDARTNARITIKKAPPTS
jgi:hypothetical protein